MDWRIRAAKIRSKLESMNVSSGERKPTMAEQIRAEREARGDDMDPLERIRSLRSSAIAAERRACSAAAIASASASTTFSNPPRSAMSRRSLAVASLELREAPRPCNEK